MIRYVKDSPFIIGNPVHFLPMEVQTEEERMQLRFCVWQEKRVWGRWKRIQRFEVSLPRLKDLLATAEFGGFDADSAVGATEV